MRVREVEVGDGVVRFRAAGEGEPVLLVHGLSGSWRWWRSVTAALAQRYAVHVVDLPRFGTRPGRVAPEDAAAWLGHFTEAAGIAPLRLVGHSLGGLVAARLAAERPELVGRLALVAPAGIPSERSLGRQPFSLLRASSGVHRLVVVADAVRAGPISLLRGAGYALATDLSADLDAVQAPALVLWGERDPLLPARLAEQWREALPRAEVRILAGSGHVPMFDAPDELVRELLAFLD